MASPSPESEIAERVEEVRVDSEDETWLKVGLTRKDRYRINSNRSTEGNRNIDVDLPSYGDVNNDNETEVETGQDITETERNDETGTVHAQSDESDDVSVITESEAEQNAENQICSDSFRTENPDCNILTTWGFQPSVFSNTRSMINTVLLCSVGVLFGLAIPHLFSMTPTVCPISSETDLRTVRAENNKLIDHMKELIEVKSILNQIKATIPQTSEGQTEKASFKKHSFKEPVRDGNFDSRPTVFRQLQISLAGISGVLTQVNNVNDLHKESIIDSQNIINDLIEIQRIMSGLAIQMKSLDRPVEAMFWQIANESIIDFSQSLLRRLSNVLLDMTANVNIKLNKIRCALNKKICHLRNTLSEEEQFFMQTEGIQKFVEHCDTIVNIRCKSYENLKKHKTEKTKDVKVKRKKQKIDVSIGENKRRNIPENAEQQDPSFAKYLQQEKVMPKMNNFKEFLTESLISQNTCPVLREPFTYAEIVAGKHFAVLEELKERKTSRNNHSYISPEIINPVDKQILADVNIMNREDPLDTEIYEKREEEYIKQLREQLDVKNPAGTNLNEFPKKLKASNKPRESKKVPNKREFNSDSFLSKEDVQKVKKRRSSSEERIDKQTKNRTNKNIKNSNKDRYKSKDYDRNRSTNSKDSRNNVNAEWQFKRSHAREEQRSSNENPNLPLDSSNWYLEWVESRKNARKRNEEHDYNDESPDTLFWHENKGRKFEKHERYSKENIRMSHRENIMQRRRD